MNESTALIHAAILVGDCSNVEYTRGICELLASLFPTKDVGTYERSNDFYKILKEVK